MFVIKRHDAEMPDDDLYLTPNGRWGLEREADQYDDLTEALDECDNQTDNSPFNHTGDYNYYVEEI